jgi:fumarate reductase subunit D
MIRGHQTHTLWIAFLLHRISGVALALFIPVHFWVLSYALTAPKTLDGFLHWTELGIVKFAEFGLVFLLSVHMFGGLRLMALEFLPWTSGQKTLAASAVAVSTLLAGLFLLKAI